MSVPVKIIFKVKAFQVLNFKYAILLTLGYTHRSKSHEPSSYDIMNDEFIKCESLRASYYCS